MPSPLLEGDALAAVRHPGSHLQIIASAGSGKTEVVSQRVADLLANGVPATAIVAFMCVVGDDDQTPCAVAGPGVSQV